MLAERFPFGNYARLCDVGGADGPPVADRRGGAPAPAVHQFDLPVVTEIAGRKIESAG